MKKVFRVEGMSCNSCANLIEGRLKDKVRKVSVSYAKGEVFVDFDKNKISESDIVGLIEEDGEFVVLGDDENHSVDKGGFADKVGFWFMIGSFVLLAYFVYGYVSDLGFSVPGVGDSVGFFVLFGIGVLTGFHCVSMCGAFVVSYTTSNAKKGHGGMLQHFIYGGSKTLSYAFIGGLFGLIGGVFSFSVGLRAGISIFAGLFMVSYALSMLGVGFFRRFSFNSKFLTRWAAKTSSESRGFYFAPFMTGILSGFFIACGPLQALYLYAAGTGSFITGFFSLASFGLGTLPVLIGFGGLTSIIGNRATKRILKVAAVLVLILGLVMLNRGLVVLGSPYSFNAIIGDIVPDSSFASDVVMEGDVQVIKMDVDASGWSPDKFTLKKGVNTRWEINVKELTGCNNEIIVRDYGLDIKLHEGLNVVEFVPDKVGSVRWSCWMGMIPGAFVVTENGVASGEQLKEAAAITESGGSCGCGG